MNKEFNLEEFRRLMEMSDLQGLKYKCKNGKEYNILNESVKLYDLTKDEKMKSLDNFLNLYEYCILKSETNNGKYEIYDLQLDSVLDDGDKTLKETITRVVDMAIDNEVNNGEFITDEEGIEYINTDYVKDLLKIQREYEKKEIC